MFTTDTMIDAVQNGNKELVKTFVKNEALSNVMNQMVDSHAAYTKEAVATATNFAAAFTKEASRMVESFDYAAFTDSLKAYKPLKTTKK